MKSLGRLLCWVGAVGAEDERGSLLQAVLGVDSMKMQQNNIADLEIQQNNIADLEMQQNIIDDKEMKQDVIDDLEMKWGKNPDVERQTKNIVNKMRDTEREIGNMAKPVSFSPSGGFYYPPHRNVASLDSGSLPFGSASLSGSCTDSSGGEGLRGESGIHCWKNINDGRLGNSHSWIPGVKNAFVGIKFKQATHIKGFRVSRKDAGQPGSCCDDRIGGTYEFQYSTSRTAGFSSPASAWKSAGTFARNTFSFVNFKFSRPLLVNAVRLKVSDAGAAIDELEVYD